MREQPNLQLLLILELQLGELVEHYRIEVELSIKYLKLGLVQ